MTASRPLPDLSPSPRSASPVTDDPLPAGDLPAVTAADIAALDCDTLRHVWHHYDPPPRTRWPAAPRNPDDDLDPAFRDAIAAAMIARGWSPGAWEEDANRFGNIVGLWLAGATVALVADIAVRAAAGGDCDRDLADTVLEPLGAVGEWLAPALIAVAWLTVGVVLLIAGLRRLTSTA